MAGAFDGALPYFDAGLPLGSPDLGLESVFNVTNARNGLKVRPNSGAKPGHHCRAEGCAFDVRWTLDGCSENVGLDLHEEIAGAGAAVDSQAGDFFT